MPLLARSENRSAEISEIEDKMIRRSRERTRTR